MRTKFILILGGVFMVSGLYAAVGIASGNNVLLFGWSKTSDPSNLTGGWCRFGIYRQRR